MATNLPVRKIGVQSRSMTGTRPDGNRYESGLERDFMTLMEGHPEFKSYHAQPLWIDYRHPVSGKKSRYAPDGLVRWKTTRRPLLVEIKYRKDCSGQWRELLAKFRAAKRTAIENEWDFEVVTEDKVRGPRLFNVEFLSAYKNRRVNLEIRRALETALATDPVSITVLSHALRTDGMNPQEVVATCWTLVAQGHLQIEWNTRVNGNSLIWLET